MFWFHLYRPNSHFRTDGAIAFDGPGADVRVDLELDFTAMTASTVGFDTATSLLLVIKALMKIQRVR